MLRVWWRTGDWLARGGGLIALVFWRLAGGAGLVRPPAAQAIGLLCGFGLVTVALARVAHHNLPVLTGHTVRRIVVVGSGIVATRVADQLQHDGGVDLVGFVDDDPLDPERWIGPLRDLPLVCEREGVDHIVVAFSRSSPEQLLEALNPLFGRMPITVVPRLFDVLPANAAVHDLGSGLLGISVAPATLGSGPRAIKRTIDIVGAGTALVLLSPLLAVVAGAIRLTSPGPALLRQHRIGRNGTGFDMVKFRSMLQPAPAAGTTTGPTASDASEAVTGPFPKLKNDPRVTRVGRLIRTTSIDELPQLWNVLKGEMSLVGPRPFVPGDAASIAGWARRRYAVRPGITGLWQVSGRNDLTFQEMCRLDSLYVSCWSVGLDLRVLLRTLRAVVTKSGAY
ncbi:MAG: sugar transferase [Actinomycetota bacterium]|nr:sugar transferase [Actinomycetota bacterium]